MATEIRKVQIVMNKPVYLGLSILVDLSKNVMYEFWYDYVKSMVEMQNFVIWTEISSMIRIDKQTLQKRCDKKKT